MEILTPDFLTECIKGGLFGLIVLLIVIFAILTITIVRFVCNLNITLTNKLDRLDKSIHMMTNDVTHIVSGTNSNVSKLTYAIEKWIEKNH